MIKVLVVETTVFGYDGISHVVMNYFQHQDHQVVKSDLVTINPVSDAFRRYINDVGSKNFVLPCRNRNPLRYLAQLVRILLEGHYQAIHAHGCSATMAVEMLAARLANVKVRIAHSHNTKCDHAVADSLLRPFFSRWCNARFACSQEAGEWMFPGKRFEILYNGIDLDKFQFNAGIRERIRREQGLAGKFVIGHVGRFSEQKNHQKLIDIFEAVAKRRHDACLVLVGDGELRGLIEARARQAGLDVLFVGVSDEVEKWLQAMDIIVFPSLFEGLPLGLVEAQAAGLPCILSDTISPMTKITDLAEFVRLDATAEVWADSIISAIGQYDRAGRLSLIRQQIMDGHFDIRQNSAELMALYWSLTWEGAGRRREAEVLH